MCCVLREVSFKFQVSSSRNLRRVETFPYLLVYVSTYFRVSVFTFNIILRRQFQNGAINLRR